MVSGQPEELTGRIKCRRFPAAIIRDEIDITGRGRHRAARLITNGENSVEIKTRVLDRRRGASSKE